MLNGLAEIMGNRAGYLCHRNHGASQPVDFGSPKPYAKRPREKKQRKRASKEPVDLLMLNGLTEILSNQAGQP